MSRKNRVEPSFADRVIDSGPSAFDKLPPGIRDGAARSVLNRVDGAIPESHFRHPRRGSRGATVVSGRVRDLLAAQVDALNQLNR